MKYLYTIRIPFEAMDDIAAREKVIGYMADASEVMPEADDKLQEVFENKPPRNIPLK
jgi:hypothetical protein